MITPLGMLGGYQETTKELIVTSVSVGQSGEDAAGVGWKEENDQIGHTEVYIIYGVEDVL